MAVEDRDVNPRSLLARRDVVFPLVAAVSQTKRVFGRIKPGHDFRVTDLELASLAQAGAVSIDAFVAGRNTILHAGALTVHSTPEQLALALSRYIVDGIVVEKAAATGITFTAAHAITAEKWGVVLVQISSAGAVSTKVPLATQAYDTAAAANAALPAADADKLAIAKILIQAEAGNDWNANTDDLTNGSDLTTATITTYAAAGALDTSIVGVTAKRVVGVVHSDKARHRGTRDQEIVLTYTSDGTGALTNGYAVLGFRKRPLNGEPQ